MYWKEIETIGTEKSEYNPGIATDYRFYKFKFINKNDGFLIGVYNNFKIIQEKKLTAPQAELNKDAIILRTIDGGYHWEESVLGKGEIIDFEQAGSILIALRQSYHGKEADETISHIHISQDSGATWREISSIETDKIDEIHFWAPQSGIAVCGLYGDRYDSIKILSTRDSGKSWKEIKLPYANEKMNFNITPQGLLYYLTPSAHSYMQVNLNNMESTEIALPFSEKPFSLVMDNNSNLYFVIEDEDKRNWLYKKVSNNHFEKIAFPVKDIMINDVWIYDNIISIVVDSYGGVCYRSEDFGKTWNKETLPNSFMRNIAFYGKENIWIRTFPGKMMVRQ